MQARGKITESLTMKFCLSYDIVTSASLDKQRRKWRTFQASFSLWKKKCYYFDSLLCLILLEIAARYVRDEGFWSVDSRVKWVEVRGLFMSIPVRKLLKLKSRTWWEKKRSDEIFHIFFYISTSQFRRHNCGDVSSLGLVRKKKKNKNSKNCELKIERKNERRNWNRNEKSE